MINTGGHPMKYLAVDVGGTSTRAVVVREDGTCVGYGRAGSGNPTSSGTSNAAAAIVEATRGAMAQAGSTSAAITAGLVGIAGANAETGEWLRVEVAKAGVPERLTFEADLLVAYFSGSLAANGYAIVAGTGAAAIRVRGGRIEAVCDGLGWLLGDAGSGFWIGHRAVLAATSALDRRGPATLLADLFTSQLGIEQVVDHAPSGRGLVLDQVVRAVYQMRPVELAQFAPLVFEAAEHGDTVAVQIVADASDALAATLEAVVVPDIGGPLVLSGSILSQQPAIAPRVMRLLGNNPDVITVSDGLAGAAVLALRHSGVDVDDTVFARIHASLAALR